MNIYQRYQAEYGYPASDAVNVANFDLNGDEAALESARLRNWLWDNYHIWIAVRYSDKQYAFWWSIEYPKFKRISNKMYFSTPQQAYISALTHTLIGHEFLTSKNSFI